MIIPTPEFDPFFARDGVPFREKMLAYLQQEFAELMTSTVMNATLQTLPEPVDLPEHEKHEPDDASRRVA